MTSAQVHLYFSSVDASLSLYSTYFEHSFGQKEQRRCYRGNVVFPSLKTGSFTWSKAVKAMVLLLLKAKRMTSNSQLPSVSTLSGFRHSLATSLDDALCKAPMWLADMFGVDSNGKLIAKRLFPVRNSGAKRPEPVVIALNGNTLPPGHIKIFLNGHEETSPETLSFLIESIAPEHKDSVDWPGCEAYLYHPQQTSIQPVLG